MIRYTLKCDNGHGFESWFQSASAFETLKNAGHLGCPDCGSTGVEKTLMSPSVSPKTKAKGKPAPAPQPPAAPAARPMAAAPDPELVKAVEKLRAHVEANSEYVGNRFAREATDMHLGDKPHRPIYGETTPEEAKRLAEDGVPALPLPFIPRQKTN
jgi:hypothetical protein